MKKAKLIYNPKSGDKSFKHKLDTIIDKLQKGGYELTTLRTGSIEDIYEGLKDAREYDCILASGGDGTINHVVNAMAKNNLDIPLGVFPAGTANDFANHLRIPKNVADVCKIINDGKTAEICLGEVNGRYFVNVAAAGLLTDISQKIDINLKNTLGKMAYYIKGLEKLPEFKPIEITIKSGDTVIKEKLFLFVLLNGSMAGGITLAPDASVEAEELSFVGIKSCNLLDLFNLFIKLIRYEHLESNHVIYLRGKEFLIDCSDKIDTDIDGEKGPEFPLDIKVSNKKLKVFVS
jgi:diacylglycerol kinase (ATP)